MQVTDLPPSVQVLRRVLVGSSTSHVASSLSIRVRSKSVSSKLVSINVQNKLAAIVKAIPTKNVPVISQGEIVSQLLFCRRKVRVSVSIVRCAMVATLLKSFPEEYKFPTDMRKQSLALMIGNALPPAFSFFQSRNIAKHIETQGAGTELTT